jgi:hypothetical protein
MIGMPQQIPEVDHIPPSDIGRVLLESFGYCSGGLAGNFQQTLRKQSNPSVRCELLKTYAAHHILDFCNSFQDVLEPVFDVGRHLEDLDQIIGDSLRHAWLEHFSYRNLGGNPRRVFDQMLNLEDIERRILSA